MEGYNIHKAGKTVTWESLAADALIPKFTDDVFVRFPGLFVEICARWIADGSLSEAKIAAFGRILPLAPQLAEHAEHFLATCSQSQIIGSRGQELDQGDLSSFQDGDLCRVLLGVFRLLSLDCRTFAKYVRPLALESLFHHPGKPVRYLAVRVFCLYVHAADYATQEMVKRHVGGHEVLGYWEGKTIDYRFLTLWEEKRWKELQSRMVPDSNGAPPQHLYQQLSRYSVNVNGVLLPRLNGTPSQEVPSQVVSTPTTEANLNRIAHALLESSPLLLTGVAGSGKTLLTRHLAWQLNKLDSMVTLHLNEQSDAKLLVGMYATGAKPGTFHWRPGVLTAAVNEGRWIFVEDLDRAPNEVVSTLLPLIERGELLIPSRGETIRAARGFRIIATMRSTVNAREQEIIPRQNMIGHRFWNSISIPMPDLEEFEAIVLAKHPALRGHVPAIMRVYARLLTLYSDPRFASDNGTSLRVLTPRDLLKWCARTSAIVERTATFNTAQKDDMFMEAFDCFAGSLRSEQSRSVLMACIAEELHIDPQRRDHILLSREVRLDVPPKSTSSGSLRIGRARLPRHKITKRYASSTPFSTNEYTLRLLEKIAVAVDRQEPLLLVGETGTGKTTCIQYLAEQLGRKLVAFNLSQQSESGDLLGGYKPVNVRSLIIPLKDEFDELFDTTFSKKKNQRFIETMGKRVAKGEWRRVCMLWREALKMVDAARKSHESRPSSPDPEGGQPKKKRKVDSLPANFPGARWEKFAADLGDLEAQLSNGSEAFAFSFLEGNIVKAVRNGDWVLLDEINLASSDTLEALADLLGGGPDGAPSILLTETGSVERIVAHPNFRVFAAMNPATDVGKKDLPSGIRSRFTEFYVESPDSDIKSLRSIVEKYLGGESNDPAIIRMSLDVTNLYLDIQRLAKSNMLVDGADQKANFSLRTLTRTLTYARDIAPLCTLRRALYEGFHMSFLTFLGKASEDLVAPLIKQHLFGEKAGTKAELGKPLQQPSDGRSYVRQGHYWLRQGAFPVEQQPHYIITPFVQRNMNNLIRAASTRKYPVLIQGPTSSGKTSMIEHLAKRSGNQFVRINNHDHTDLQEYLGSYISGTDGKLQFQEGILVRALREGHWIVLDELNLAPTDVLEALNRLLDDNRELLIPETQEVVRPHEDFMLFATQNPAGLYGGRKVLSRAFRNRFLELHFDDIPVEELTEILHRRTLIPESWCKRIVKVYEELSMLRQENRIFEQKSFATLRDLFRWAQRKADTIQDLASNGYMLLAERVRKEEERQVVKRIIESVMSKNGPKVNIDEERLYGEDTAPEIRLCKEMTGDQGDVVWTRAMRRLFVLVAHAIQNNEPVLLIGETGCGKTTVCQMLADALEKQLHIVNAHQNTETGDLIGAQRPIRNRASIEDLLRRQVFSVLESLQPHVDYSDAELDELLKAFDALGHSVKESIPADHRAEIQANRIKVAALFEWADGSLVHAMKTGQFFLLDEISLADDSVLERLNSVLESSRTLLLAEKGVTDSFITATEGFQFLATMNPGGDYGKKELSPALRNRFTEIWVPALSDVEDVLQIVRSKLKASASHYAGSIVSFAQWFNEKFNTSVSSSISIRDTLAWVTFINDSRNEDPVFAIVHGAAMVFIDTLGANPAGLLAISSSSIDEERKACLHRLSKLLGTDVTGFYLDNVEVSSTSISLQLGRFSIPKIASTTDDSSFSFEAPTTRSNAMRVVRALQLSKPILLEGNPGVGKTTLVMAIARAIGKPLTRLNLSDQTDLMDLFGSDVPVDGGQAGTFAWRDAPFLKAMKNGDWVLLDEMNLASQSVLEGMNAVLDHRGEVYISELDQKFHKHPDFRVFAAQNPHHQGGGRKGLPASFVNRFTVVYADVFRPHDLSLICTKVFPGVNEDEINKLIGFVAALDEQVVTRRSFGALGSPWEFNLRDTLRWLQLLHSEEVPGSARDFLDTIFLQRFRSEGDRQRILKLFADIYGKREPRMSFYHDLAARSLQVGAGWLSRDSLIARPDIVSPLRISQLGPMEALMISVQQNWPVILVGPPASGKTALVSQIASFVGAKLTTFSMNADIDAMDLVGGYEQEDPSREINSYLVKLEEFVRRHISESQTPTFLSTKLLELLSASPNRISDEIYSLLETIAMGSPGSVKLPGAQVFLRELERLSQAPMVIEGARFRWVDGILIQALERGDWLVLDNANLCSSAVLDRLNSLLEPGGYLSINEHSTADGEARDVRPHKNFRIFMTVDPRYGELSRAMRNRGVEIYLLPHEHAQVDGVRIFASSNAKLPTYLLESDTYRFRTLLNGSTESMDTLDVAVEHLNIRDRDLFGVFDRESTNGLLLPMSKHQTNGASSDWALVSSNGREPLAIIPTMELPSLSQFIDDKWHMMACQLEVTLIDIVVGRSDLQHMPYQPLANEAFLQRGDTVHSLSVLYSSAYDVHIDLNNMKHAIEAIPSLKFERRKEKQEIPNFLHAFRRLILAAINFEADPTEVSQFDALLALRLLMWAFIELATNEGFDRATFQTYLKMLNEELNPMTHSPIPKLHTLASSVSKELTKFGPGVQLTTGLGMERIWRSFRPKTPKTVEGLAAVLDLESLADRLDTAMWGSGLKIEEMIQVRERFSGALDLVRTQDVDPAELILNLGNAVHELEERVVEEDVVVTPYFQTAFEGLCQFLDIIHGKPETPTDSSGSVKVVRMKSSLLAQRPTKAIVSGDQHPSQYFLRLYHFLGLDHHSVGTIALDGRFHVLLLDKIHHADEVQLAQLDRFETELQTLSQHISLDAETITERLPDALPQNLRTLMTELVASHEDVILRTSPTIIELKPKIQISNRYKSVLTTLLGSCIPGIHAAGTASGDDAQAWINFALAGLTLYVPNYPFDPALKPMIERKLFNTQKKALSEKLEALRKFQIGFTGQDTSFRIRQIEGKIDDMGVEPPVPAIVRPEVSELDVLQGEFANLLSILSPLLAGTMPTKDACQDHTLRQNISHVIRRLSEGYRSYDDITGPAVGFLVCLSIGLRISARSFDDLSGQGSLQYFRRHTPFLGLYETTAKSISESLVHSCESEIKTARHVADLRWHALHSLTLIRAVDQSYLSDVAAKQLLHNIFGSFFTDYKQRLLQDQDKQAQDTSLYTYKGEDEEVEEEDPELFPNYEKDNVEAPVHMATSNSRDHALRLADMHAKVFTGTPESCESLRNLLEWCTAQTVRISEGQAHGSRYESAMPAIFLALEKKSDALSTSGTGRQYNFYFDANIPEGKRLVSLVHRIRQRYRQIQKVWPEHATLADVLRSCDESLAFSHVDPVAKFITKAEKLHAYMYEWQGVASREFSTANLYDDLTKLLVSWRQLELTTWARLFDIEIEKCRSDAKSWFFMAYETIIAASESIEDEKEMEMHARNLLKTLEVFFLNTSLGQFEQRIRLLEQFREHVKIRRQDVEPLRHVHLALDNFIAYLERLQKPVQENIAKGRQTLEKEVGNVIKLATWKDTNIEALKQSAKTSHRKLSKLVRKFRALLNQPVSAIYNAGFPEVASVGGEITMEIVTATVDPYALEICDKIPYWNNRPTRFKNLNATLSIMRSKANLPSESVNGADYIDFFIADLESSITQLQKATPALLTEENKEGVQHLKSRKRKLYADTMKELRQMGVRPNLSSDILDKQEKLSTVLASLPIVKSSDTGAAEYLLHRSLSLMSQVRAIYKEHSGDLTGNDVSRSIGYIEGLLNSAIRQRGLLGRATESLSGLETSTSRIAELCKSSRGLVRVPEAHATAAGTKHTGISWLCAMLKTGAEICAAQAKLGKTNEFDAVVRGLKEWAFKFDQLLEGLAAVPSLPSTIWSQERCALEELAQQQLAVFRGVFEGWMQQFPLPRTILRQIQPYIPKQGQEPITLVSYSSTIEGHVNQMWSAFDLILGSMQDVEVALKGVPTSTEDAAWLVREEDALFSALSQLHAPQIITALDLLTEQIQYLSTDEDVPLFATALSTIRPILDQYLACHKHLLDRFTALHTSTAKLLLRLAKTFIQVGTQGFCTPSDKSAGDEKGKDDKLESGTGLGEGEGAEDISKDIEDDEDLDDLAQEKGGERENSIEDQEDAIDMGEQEMEGEMGEAPDKEDEGGEGEEGDEEDVESQVGSVDDLGPSAVDEKMWDEGGKEDDLKGGEGDRGIGEENEDEQVANEEQKQKESEKEKDKEGEEGEKKDEEEEEEEDVDMEGEDQDENVGAGETEKMDPYAKEDETLDLPEELNIDGQEDEGDDEKLGDMDMDDDLPEEEMDAKDEMKPDTVDENIGPEEEGAEENETTNHVPDEEKMDGEPQEDEPVDDDVIDLPDEQGASDESRQPDDNSDPNAEAGAGAEANEEAHRDQKEDASASAANREDGNQGETSEKKQESTTEDGSLGQATQPDAGGRGEEQPEESPETQSFKKIGDTLERWYNQQKQISEARQKDESMVKEVDKEVDMVDAEFEHLQDEEEKEDTQALGTATEEQAKTLDQDMAMAVHEEEKVPDVLEDMDNEQRDVQDHDVEMQDAEPQHDDREDKPTNGQPQAFIGERKDLTHPEDAEMADALPPEEDDNNSDTTSVNEVETRLELTHLNPSHTHLPSPSTARALWLHHEAATRSLSQQLTEHLRLILAPTLATKLRGDFRTGKRLNLKRIIPYIASGYKRDKIWLRRSMPSKRNYQIMIALDDSRSMAENGASALALKTLALVTRSLSMLEVGEVAVVGFGDEVTVAHPFDLPFTSESGVKVFEQFGFQASKTNVRGLAEKSLGLFREARANRGSGSEDLWQLCLIVSDGICDDHAGIQRLVRQARDERVMLVFVVVDATANTNAPAHGHAPTTVNDPSSSSSSSSLMPTHQSQANLGVEAKENTSIMDLQSVEISPEGKVVRWRYMDRFPFRYYLVVRDVRELPGVLAGALRQWFAEVAEST
ncbi:hypothetical protein BCR34DRAFT_608897 [Clohesyomyces aquaticus]|uniref:Midasin n=1 Tax=Clohesyomyces aquaticus TaxID=1231657 RepID=A0A1Y1Y217_9PLEO|nr:hypothetical protein BCR34DRAFT_608897 [Clohesyomyces aquaticus]